MSEIIPSQKIWIIGDKEFMQTPFGLDRTGGLFAMIGELLSKPKEEKDLKKIMEVDTSNRDDIIGLIGMIMKMAPDVFVKFICLCLDVLPDSKDGLMIGKKCSPSMAMKIVQEFIRQNDIEEIKNDFLALRTTLSNQKKA